MSIAVDHHAGTIFEVIRQILIHAMDLDEERVNIARQKFKIPPDEHLFIVIDCLPARTISSRARYEINPASGDYEEIQDLNQYDPITIGVFSQNLEALQRKEEVVMALSSHYAQQMQEKHSFKIFRNAPVEDMTALEGAAMLYRYDIPVVLHTWIHKVTKVDFFDAFSTKVSVNDGLPLMTEEFDQPLSSSSSAA
jgi:hypothetical protein